MDERIDILDPSGHSTGKTALKSEAHKNGWFHPTVHIWFFTSDARVLIQQRAKTKETHPLLWDVSVAGHVGAGENKEDAAVREVREEIGIDITKEDLLEIGVFKSIFKISEEVTDCEFHHTFLCPLKPKMKDLSRQESEVADLALIPLIRFSEETWGMANLRKYVPHGAEYYKTVVKAVKERL